MHGFTLEGVRRLAAWFSGTVTGYAAVFRIANLRRSQVAWATAVTAEWAFFVGVGVFAFDHGGAFAVGIVGFVRMLPSALVGPFASALGDRYRRDLVVFALFVTMAATVAVAALALFSDPPAAWIYALAGVHATAATLSRPAQWALLPFLCRSPEELVAANGATLTTESIGTLAGPVLGGLLLGVTGVDSLFAACAAMYAVAALVISRVRMEPVDAATAPAGAGLLSQLTGGLRALAEERGAAFLIGLFCAQAFVRGALNVYIVVISFELLDIRESGVGFLTAAIGAGGLVGAFAAVSLSGRRLAAPFAAGLVLWGLPIAVVGAWPETVVALLMIAVIGGGNSVLDVAGLTLLQRLVPNDVLTRVLGVLWGLAMAMMGVGSIVGAALVDGLGIRTALTVTGFSLPVLTLLSWRRLVRIDRSAAIPVEQLAVIDRVPMLAQLSLVAKEQVAGQLMEVDAAPATDVVREGETGDRFYILVEGEADVLSNGRKVASREGPDYFGEIALLRDVPRTATVRARSPLRLYALGREDFIAAVTGHAAGLEAGLAVVKERLSTTN
jgi:MFS family permease